MTLSTRLRMALAYADMNCSDLARALGVTRMAVSKWCKGRTTPRPEHLLAIVHVTGVPLEWLMRRSCVFSEEETITALRTELSKAELALSVKAP